MKAGKTFRNFLRGLMHGNFFSYFLLIFSPSHLFFFSSARHKNMSLRKCPVVVRSLILENVLFYTLLISLFLSPSLSFSFFFSLSLFLSHPVMITFKEQERTWKWISRQKRILVSLNTSVNREWEWERQRERHEKYFSCKWREFTRKNESCVRITCPWNPSLTVIFYR